MGDSSYDDLHDWDPMKESFCDESFNSYTTGPGSRLPRHQQPANLKERESLPTKLHLYPLTARYTKDALANIFRRYGEVDEVYIHDSYLWAFVTMKTFAAAETAISNVSKDPQLKFTVKFAREKSDSVHVGASETKLSKMNHRKSEDGSQFNDSFKRKSINDRGSTPERSVIDPSERPNPKSNHQRSANMNGDIVYQTVPNCCCCKCQTPDTCAKCLQPFCSIDCMIRGYKGHTSQCVRLPKLTSQMRSPAKNPSTTYQPVNDHSPAMNQDFSSRNDSKHYEQFDVGVSNSRKSNCMNDLGTKFPENDSRDIYDGRSAASPNSRAFEPDKKDNGPRHDSPYDRCKNLDEACINFNISADGKRNDRRKHDNTFNRLNQESGWSRSNDIENSANRSKVDRVSPWDRQSQGYGNRSSKENVPSWGNQSPVSGYRSRENDLSKNNRSRVSGNCPNYENESSWESDSQASEYHAKTDDSSRDNRSRNNLDKENKSSWDSRSQVSGYRTKRQNTWSKDNQSWTSGNHSNKENESERMVSGYHLKKDSSRENRFREFGDYLNKKNESWETQSTVSEYHAKREKPSWKDNRSRISGNRSSKENESTWDVRSTCGYISSREDTSSKDRRSHEMGSVRRPDKRKEFKVSEQYNASSHSPAFEVNFSPKKIDLSSLFRVDIKENDKFEVKLAESGPPAVLITQECGSLNSMIDILQEFNLKPMDDFSEGQKCAVKRTPDDYGTWYRGLIVDDDPLRVKFIDFSYEPVKVRRDDVRIIPEEFISIHPFCYRVNFMNASIDEVDELKNIPFEVEFLSKEYATWNVNLVRSPHNEELPDTKNISGTGEQFGSRMKQKNAHRSLPDLKVVLKKGVPIEVYVTHIDTYAQKMYVTIRHELEKVVHSIENICPLPDLEEIRLNAMCVALYEEGWYRAKVISVNPLEVYFVDFGNIEATVKSNLKMLPDEFKQIDPLVVPVKFRNGSKSSVVADESVEIVPIEEKSGIWIVRLASEPEVLENEDPHENSRAPEAALGEIIEVQVTYKVSNSEYYACPKNMGDLLEMVEITDEEVIKLGSLKTTSVGMLCVKMFEGIWCRARVIELEPLTIYYLDFGNDEEVQIEKLYPLPERLRAIPPVAFKIHLKPAQNLPMYEPLKIQKVTEQYWTAVNDF